MSDWAPPDADFKAASWAPPDADFAAAAPAPEKDEELPQKAQIYPGDDGSDWLGDVHKAWSRLVSRHGSPMEMATAVPETILGATTGMVAPASAAVQQGINYLTGRPAQSYSELKRENTYEPTSPFSRDQLNLLSAATQPITGSASDLASMVTSNPDTKEAVSDAILSASPLVTKALSGKLGPSSETPSEPPYTGELRGEPFQPEDVPGKPGIKVDDPPSDTTQGGLPPEVQAERRAILARTGHTQARDSALRGDPLDASSDYQMTKFNEPAGRAALQQFQNEKQTQIDFGNKIIKDVGGSSGVSDSALANRGQAIAAPFDALRDWFDKLHEANYADAKERLGSTPVSPDETAALLKDPDFTETLMAKGQDGLLNSMQRQFARFQRLRVADGFTADNAENFTKWLNGVWTPENSSTLGKVKEAVRNDVTRAAGEDVYGPARQAVVLEHQLLDDPSGVSRLFDKDPKTPINRTTPFEKIPDAISKLPQAQLDNLMTTLHAMPEEVQPLAQRAIGEIKGHFINRALDEGTPNAPEGLWNSPRVSDYLESNRGKIETAFRGDSENLANVSDWNSAGKILRAPPAYPGAAASAANAMKKGLMSSAIARVSGMAGSGLGSLVPIPGAAVVGAGAGEVLGRHASTKLGEQRALKNWQKSVVPIQRAAGGKVDIDTLVNKLINRWHAARRETNETTKPLLKVPDAAIVRALDIAQEHI